MEKSLQDHPLKPETIERGEGRYRIQYFRVFRRFLMLALFAGSAAALEGCASQKKDLISTQTLATTGSPAEKAAETLLGQEFECYATGSMTPEQAAAAQFAKATGLSVAEVEAGYVTEIVKTQNEEPRETTAKVTRKTAAEPAHDINPRPVPEWITGMIPGTIEFRAKGRSLAGVTDEAYEHVAAQMNIGIDDARANYSVTPIEFDRNLRTVRANIEAKGNSNAEAKKVSIKRDLEKGHDLEALRYQMLTLVNKDRKANTLSALEADRLLDQFAQFRSDEIAGKGIPGSKNHNLNPGQNILKKNQVENMPIGENVSVFANLKEAEAAWMKDGNSRDCILSKQFRRVGFGVTKHKDGRLVLVQLFSKPSPTLEDKENNVDLGVNLADSDKALFWLVKTIRAFPKELGLPDDLIQDGQLDMRRLRAWATDFVNDPNPKKITVSPSSFKFVRWLIDIFSKDIGKKLKLAEGMMDENGVIDADALKVMLSSFLRLEPKDDPDSEVSDSQDGASYEAIVKPGEKATAKLAEKSTEATHPEAPKTLDFGVSENASRIKATEEGYAALGKKLGVSAQEARRDYVLLLTGFEKGQSNAKARVLRKKESVTVTTQMSVGAHDGNASGQAGVVEAEKPTQTPDPLPPASNPLAKIPNVATSAQEASTPAQEAPVLAQASESIKSALSSVMTPENLRALEGAPSLTKKQVSPFIKIAQNNNILPKQIDSKTKEAILNVFCDNKKLIVLATKVLEKASSMPTSKPSAEIQEKLEQLSPYLEMAKENRAALPPVVNQLIDKGMNWILENPQPLLDLIHEANQGTAPGK